LIPYSPTLCKKLPSKFRYLKIELKLLFTRNGSALWKIVLKMLKVLKCFRLLSRKEHCPSDQGEFFPMIVSSFQFLWRQMIVNATWELFRIKTRPITTNLGKPFPTNYHKCRANFLHTSCQYFCLCALYWSLYSLLRCCFSSNFIEKILSVVQLRWRTKLKMVGYCILVFQICIFVV
jgi:hypothetical protein